MPDYIYLLENRLSQNQQNALRTVRDVARDAQMTVFLAGSAVRDLTSGSSVRELEFSIQGDIRKLRKTFEDQGIAIWAEDAAARKLYLSFPGAVRVEVGSTKTTAYPKPGKPTYHWGSIQEDLRHRDFTVNAMALSLNEGSYGLLMDPLNGVADIESRHLRLVSNYGFLENPILLARAIRLRTRLGWEMDEKTAQRYENAKSENLFDETLEWDRSLELQAIAHEEDALRVVKALEAEDWMQKLFPSWSSDKADIAGLEKLHEILVQLQMQGVHPDTAAASMQLLTAKMDAKSLESLKSALALKGFVEKWNSLDAIAKQFSQVLLSKDNASPSATWKLFTSYDPEAILWLGLTSKSAPVQEKYKNFFTVWPEVRQKVPYALMQEMRIVPDLEGYQELVQKIFLELIDGRLATTEEIREFLKPYSPPAPPPPVTIKRSRGGRKALAEMKSKIEEEEEDEDEEEHEMEEADFEADDEAIEADFGALGKLAANEGDEEEEEEDEDEEEEAKAPAPAKKGKTPPSKAEVAEKQAAKPKAPEPVPAKKPAHETKAPAAAKEEKAEHGAEKKHAVAGKTVPAPAGKREEAPKAPPAKAAPAHPPAPVKKPEVKHEKHEAKHEEKHAGKKVEVKPAVKHPAKKEEHKPVAKTHHAAAKPEKKAAAKPAVKAPAKAAAKSGSSAHKAPKKKH